MLAGDAADARRGVLPVVAGLVEPTAADSAHPTALRILRHLAQGEIEAAAALSNAPRQRLELLRNYRNFVGEEEFKRIYGRYLAPENKLVAEVALGPRRLLVWDLGEASVRQVQAPTRLRQSALDRRDRRDRDCAPDAAS